jgi:hypothetical protein
LVVAEGWIWDGPVGGVWGVLVVDGWVVCVEV